jgi:hypothetical protein
MNLDVQRDKKVALALAVAKIEKLSCKVQMTPYFDELEPFYDWAFDLD